MDPVVTPLIERIRRELSFVETRSPATSLDYFEGVLLRANTDACLTLLHGAFGEPMKALGVPVTFEPETRLIVEQLGGIRLEQALFLKPRDTRHGVYAALWPWASNAERVTLKVGVYRVQV